MNFRLNKIIDKDIILIVIVIIVNLLHNKYFDYYVSSFAIFKLMTIPCLLIYLFLGVLNLIKTISKKSKLVVWNIYFWIFSLHIYTALMLICNFSKTVILLEGNKLLPYFKIIVNFEQSINFMILVSSLILVPIQAILIIYYMFNILTTILRKFHK